MAKISRRNLFAKTGIGAAAVGALAVAPAVVLTQRNSGPAKTARALPPPKTIPSVAYVRDAAKGEVVLMFGTRAVVRTDPELVAYLGRCCGPTMA
jgi:hypothetical protein